MERRYLAALILVLAAVAVGAFFVLRGGDAADTALQAMSAQGAPIEFPVPAKLGPWGDVTGEAILIAERAGIRFLRLPRKDGSSCWATGDRRGGGWNITNFNCETGFLRFPDARRPLMVVARLMPASPADPRIWTYDSFAGFAADGVKRVAIVDAEDRTVPVAEVVGNVFYAATPPAEVKRVIGLDEKGEVIWRGAVAQIPDE